MSGNVERVKERLSIEEVVGWYLELKSAGASLKARCPFHSEKTPSFFVSPSRGTFYCFGCGEKGDIFSFVEKMEGLDFMGALKMLAEKGGVTLERVDLGNKDKTDRTLSLLEEATLYYASNLKTNSKVADYLKERGLTEETVGKFDLGYSLPVWRGVLDFLVSRGYSVAEIERAGLIKKNDRGDFYDRFRGRIMFPIRNRSGRVIAYSGRFFESSGGGGADEAKYINSPETEVFQKSRVLYGYDKARESIRRSNCAIVVEGQMDLLMMHQSGYPNTVAVSGTALTSEHLSALEKLSKRLVLAFDADKAGLSAAKKAANLALLMGFEVKVAAISGGKDPADLALSSKEELKKVIRSSVHIVDFLLNKLSKEGHDLHKFRVLTGREVLPLVANVGSRIERAHFVERVANVLGISEEAVAEDLSKIKHSPNESLLNAHEEKSTLTPFSIAEKIWGLALLADSYKLENPSGEDLRGRLGKLLTPPETKETERLLFEVEASLPKITAESVAERFEELFGALRREVLNAKLSERARELKLAENSDNKEEVLRLEAECQEISKEISALHQELKK